MQQVLHCEQLIVSMLQILLSTHHDRLPGGAHGYTHGCQREKSQPRAGWGTGLCRQSKASLRATSSLGAFSLEYWAGAICAGACVSAWRGARLRRRVRACAGGCVPAWAGVRLCGRVRFCVGGCALAWAGARLNGRVCACVGGCARAWTTARGTTWSGVTKPWGPRPTLRPSPLPPRTSTANLSPFDQTCSDPFPGPPGTPRSHLAYPALPIFSPPTDKYCIPSSIQPYLLPSLPCPLRDPPLA